MDQYFPLCHSFMHRNKQHSMARSQKERPDIGCDAESRLATCKALSAHDSPFVHVSFQESQGRPLMSPQHSARRARGFIKGSRASQGRPRNSMLKAASKRGHLQFKTPSCWQRFQAPIWRDNGSRHKFDSLRTLEP